MNKRLFATTLLLTALVACGGGGSNSGGGTTNPLPTPLTPTITAPSTAIKGQSYQASTPIQTGITFTWGITNGTITAGQGSPNITFSADTVGNLVLTCVAYNSANTASGTAYYNTTVQDPPPPPPTVYPGIFRPLKSATPASQFRFQASYANSGSLNMSTPRAFHTSTQMLDGRIVILGGTAQSNLATTIDIFDPAAERFTTAITTLPVGRTNHAAVLLDNNTIAILGGGVGTIEVYDPTLDTLTTVMPFDAQRNQSKAVNIGGNRILVFGGYDASGYFNPVIIDTVTWTQRTISTDINLHRIDFSFITLKNGKVLFSGGSGDAVKDPKGMDAVRDDVFTFDPETETFTTVGKMTMPRGRHSMIELPNGEIGIYGGGDGNTLQKSTETFSLTTNTSTAGGNMIGAKAYMNSVYLQNGYTLHAGGLDDLGYVVNTQMIYDPASKASGYTNSMLSSRKDFTLTLMPNGCYLVTGGQNTTGVLDTAEVFDPQASVNITYPYAAIPTSESVQLTASGDTDGLVWTCDIGSVDQTGKYTAPDMPTTAAVAYVTATNSKGKSAIVHVSFLKDVVTIVAPETVKAGTTTTLTANVTWFADKTVTWSCNVGTIDASTGALNVTGVGNGETVYVTAKSNANDKIYDMVKIVVVP